MKIKKYFAESLREGKQRIIEELGDDAVILSSRVIKNPENGGDAYEIVAALDESVAKQSKPSKPKDVQKKPTPADEPSKILQSAIMMDKNTDRFIGYFDELYEKLTEINDYVKYKYSGTLGGNISNLYKILRKVEFEDEYALQITGKLNVSGKYESLIDLAAEARKMIVTDIKIKKNLQKSSGRQIVILIGPTGSGKTTSLVKLAVITKIMQKANVLIVSSDTYKVGGSEQLQTFSSIAGIPFSAVYSPEELRGLLSKENNYDFIFIDTVGINPKIKENLNSLKEFINASKAEHIFLVQNATASHNSFKSVFEYFSKLGINGLILTKVDEAVSLGSVVGLLREINLPLAYITNGQQIPQDIESASKSILGKLILPDELL